MGKYEIFLREDGEFHFNLKAKNNEVILTSEGYKAKESAKNGIESVKKHSGDPAMFQVEELANGKWHFNLKAGNGQVIGTSQLYESFDNMNKGIASVMVNAACATIEDLTLA